MNQKQTVVLIAMFAAIMLIVLAIMRATAQE